MNETILQHHNNYLKKLKKKLLNFTLIEENFLYKMLCLA